jgi:hypothetical protein
MQPNSIKVSGSTASLDALRNDLLRESQAAQINVTDLTAEPNDPPGDRVRGTGDLVGELALQFFIIHIPAGVAAHLLYDSVWKWLKDRADPKHVRIQ